MLHSIKKRKNITSTHFVSSISSVIVLLHGIFMMLHHHLLYIQVPTILDSLSGDLLYKRIFLIYPSRMDRDREKMVEKILNLTLEILFRLTGEDYTVVKKTSSESCQDPVCEGWGRPLSPITGPPPHPLIHEEIDDQKILELTYKMIELLTGEVPIRCQDITIYFSMEEWEYLEGHKDLYKDVMMEVPQPLTSPVVSSKRTTPERCPRPLLSQDCKEENSNIPQYRQGEDLTHINTTETYVRGDERCKEEIPTDDYPGDYFRSSEGHVMSSVHMKDLSSDPFQERLSFDASHNIKKNKRKKFDHQKVHIVEKPFSCIKCGKRFTHKSNLAKHEKHHKEVKPFSCSYCGKCFTKKSHLVRHQRIHTEQKTFLCLECGKGFIQKSHLVSHQSHHTGVKPFPCSECGKCFMTKTHLVRHQRIHTGVKPFSCSECGKCFIVKSHLVIHQRIHTGVKPFTCSECGKCFTTKTHLLRHHKIHTGEKPFSCSECGKSFNQRPHLVRHKSNHTGEKYFLFDTDLCSSQVEKQNIYQL
ncbi:zinc finger protein 547-like [Ranitomeya imitator]|uniref:zinc finger protein 547-like n=1 Tax=Ranitomeya imitator TaxID=111125 RepID=UPI0037E87701